MSNIKLCPHCTTSTDFLVMVTRTAQIRFDGQSPDPAVIKEAAKFTYEAKVCMNPACKKDVTNADLLDADFCKECNTLVPVSELEDGTCVTCTAKTARPDLLNMSQTDLIKMIIQMEKQQGKKTSAINNTIAKAEEVLATQKPSDEELAAKRSAAAKKAAETKRKNALAAAGADTEIAEELDGTSQDQDLPESEIEQEEVAFVPGDLPIDTSTLAVDENKPAVNVMDAARERMKEAAIEQVIQAAQETIPEDQSNPIDNLLTPPPTIEDNDPF